MNKYAVGIILGFLGAGLICEAQANPVLEQAPLVFEYNLAGPATVEPEPIFAAGIIKTIWVSYEFTGQVRLEASTNGGVDYIKIINGQPLVDGFIPGSQLRLRAIIGPASSLKKLIIGYTDSSGLSRLYRNPDLANYKNRREIYISGGSREVFNYPLRLNLDPRFRGDDKRERGNDATERGNDGRERGNDARERGNDATERGDDARENAGMTRTKGSFPRKWESKTDSRFRGNDGIERGNDGIERGDDKSDRGLSPQGTVPEFYFTAADGQTPLYYYLEGPAHFYVKVPQIPKEGTKIYVYYKNKGDGSVFSSGHSHESGNLIPAFAGMTEESAGMTQGSAGMTQGSAGMTNLFNDGNKVFPFFEDFSGTALNEEKWEIIPGLKKEYGVKDGYLRIKDCLAVTRDFKTQEGILEFKARAEENAGIQAVIRTKVSAGLSPYEQIVYSSNYPGAEHTIAINNIAKVNVSKPIQPLTDYIYQATVNSTGILFERYSADRREKQAEIKFLDVGNFGAGYLGLKADTAPFNAGSVYFDWIRVRPYVEVEPEAVKNE